MEHLMVVELVAKKAVKMVDEKELFLAALLAEKSALKLVEMLGMSLVVEMAVKLVV